MSLDFGSLARPFFFGNSQSSLKPSAVNVALAAPQQRSPLNSPVLKNKKEVAASPTTSPDRTVTSTPDPHGVGSYHTPSHTPSHTPPPSREKRHTGVSPYTPLAKQPRLCSLPPREAVQVGARYIVTGISGHGDVFPEVDQWGKETSYTVFFIQVSCNTADPSSWVVYRRYRDFEELREGLRRLRLASRLPNLPGKPLFFLKPTPEFLLKRQMDLESWLKTVCHLDLSCSFMEKSETVQDTAVFKDFLTVGVNAKPSNLTVASSTSNPHGTDECDPFSREISQHYDSPNTRNRSLDAFPLTVPKQTPRRHNSTPQASPPRTSSSEILPSPSPEHSPVPSYIKQFRGGDSDSPPSMEPVYRFRASTPSPNPSPALSVTVKGRLWSGIISTPKNGPGYSFDPTSTPDPLTTVSPPRPKLQGFAPTVKPNLDIGSRPCLFPQQKTHEGKLPQKFPAMPVIDEMPSAPSIRTSGSKLIAPKSKSQEKSPRDEQQTAWEEYVNTKLTEQNEHNLKLKKEMERMRQELEDKEKTYQQKMEEKDKVIELLASSSRSASKKSQSFESNGRRSQLSSNDDSIYPSLYDMAHVRVPHLKRKDHRPGSKKAKRDSTKSNDSGSFSGILGLALKLNFWSGGSPSKISERPLLPKYSTSLIQQERMEIESPITRRLLESGAYRRLSKSNSTYSDYHVVQWDGTDAGAENLLRGESLVFHAQARSFLRNNSPVPDRKSANPTPLAIKVKESHASMKDAAVQRANLSSSSDTDMESVPSLTGRIYSLHLDFPKKDPGKHKQEVNKDVTIESGSFLQSTNSFQTSSPAQTAKSTDHLLKSLAVEDDIFAYIFSFLGSPAAVAKSREWSHFFYHTLRPGCRFYAHVVRAQHGCLVRPAREALWQQLVLCPSEMQFDGSKLYFNNEDFPSLKAKGEKGVHARSIQKDVRRILGWNALSPKSRDDVDINSDNQMLIEEMVCSVLYAMSEFFPQVGYCQGSSFMVFHLMFSLGLLSLSPQLSIADDLIRTCREAEGFHALHMVFSHYGLAKLYASDLEHLNRLIQSLKDLIRLHLPELNAHFDGIGFDVYLFAIGWVESLLVYIEAMPIETLTRIWTIWIAEKSFKIFHQAIIAILKQIQPELLKFNFEKSMQYFQTIPNPKILQPEELLPLAMKVHVPAEIYCLEGSLFC